MWLRERRTRISAAVFGLAVVAALFAQCAGRDDSGFLAEAPPPIGRGSGGGLEATRPPEQSIPTPKPKVIATTKPKTIATPKKKTIATPKPRVVATPKVKTVAAKPVRKKKKLLADVDPKDFVVSGIEVSESGYKATIDGWIRLTRKGTLAQPLLEFELEDGRGNLIHAGTFTPVDATGPIWLGYDALGLKRVPFTTTVDLRGNSGVLPAIPPRPYSASVRVAEVIDAKPVK